MHIYVINSVWSQYELHSSCDVILVGKLRSGRSIIAAYRQSETEEDIAVIELYSATNHTDLQLSAVFTTSQHGK